MDLTCSRCIETTTGLCPSLCHSQADRKQASGCTETCGSCLVKLHVLLLALFLVYPLSSETAIRMFREYPCKQLEITKQRYFTLHRVKPLQAKSLSRSCIVSSYAVMAGRGFRSIDRPSRILVHAMNLRGKFATREVGPF
jgi:hypothetical protein